MSVKTGTSYSIIRLLFYSFYNYVYNDYNDL